MTKTQEIRAEARAIQDEIAAAISELEPKSVGGWEEKVVPLDRFGHIMKVVVAETKSNQSGPYLLPVRASVCLCVLEGSIQIGPRTYSKTNDPDMAFAVIPSSAGREVYAIDRPSAVAFCFFQAGGVVSGSEVDTR